MKNDNKVSIMVVPTGVGAKIGGYAGDASLVARKIASKIPLIVNPNVVNAAVFSGITDNMLYVEGSSINKFVRGEIGLLQSSDNKIGVIFDKAIPQNILNIHLNTLNAVKTVYGVDVIGYEITEEVVGVSFYTTDSGVSSGSVNCPETLKKAGEKLLSMGANVLAVVCFFEEPDEDGYENGNGVDVVGGVEAVVSHYLTTELTCPCVHAPAFADVVITDKLVDSKVSAEYITPTFLPCLLLGLKNAPLYVKDSEIGALSNKNIHSIVVPVDSLGSPLVLDAIENNIPVYAVKENTTILDINCYSIGKQNDIIEIDSYEYYINEVLE